jgi:hypothetical protein
MYLYDLSLFIEKLIYDVEIKNEKDFANEIM